MNPEINFFGVYAPSLLVCAPIAYIFASAIRLTLGAFGLYRFIWHHSLFNVAVFVCLLGASLHLLLEVSL